MIIIRPRCSQVSTAPSTGPSSITHYNIALSIRSIRPYMSELNNKIVSATKWSSITEIAAKLVAPISTMVLARVLTPEAFGVMVTATMVISFAEIFTDAGFQKYIVQHEFEDEKKLFTSTNVAFWSNFVLSLIIWFFIVIFAEPIAELVGNKGYGNVILVSCICIPLAAFSSIQMAIYRRHFDYKTLFLVRMVGVAIPLVITIPLAFWIRSYWALVAGMIGLNLSNALILTAKSRWKPKFEYSWQLFKDMFAFTSWSLLEAILIWLTSYVDIFIVGKMLDSYYLGIYRTSMSTVGQFTGLITAATSTVLFSSLSRLQGNRQEFQKVFFHFQKLVGLLILPLGVGIFLFRDLIVEILLGSQWHQAAYFMGIWALTTSITVVLSHYSSEAYRSIGKPRISVLSQILHLAVLIPVVYYFIRFGFTSLCTARALVRFEAIAVNLVLMYIFVKISGWKMIKNIIPEVLAAASMCLIMLLPHPESICLKILHMLMAIVIYIVGIIICPSERYLLFNLKKYFKR